MIISERIFQLLESKNISQKEFSEKTKIAQSTISDWKRKKTNPASDKIMIICDVLGVSPVELLSGAENTGFKKLDYILVDKNSVEYDLVNTYQSLDAKTQARIRGYIEALKGE